VGSRARQQDGRRGADRRLGRERADALAERAIADLVVVLQKSTNAVVGSEALGSPRGASPRCADGFALVGETLAQRAGQQPSGFVRVVAVVAERLAGEQNVERVVRVIVPLRVEPREQPGLVRVVFQHQLHVAPVLDAGVHSRGQLVEEGTL